MPRRYGGRARHIPLIEHDADAEVLAAVRRTSMYRSLDARLHEGSGEPRRKFMRHAGHNRCKDDGAPVPKKTDQRYTLPI
jgi:hypothetical protein